MGLSAEILGQNDLDNSKHEEKSESGLQPLITKKIDD